MVGLSSCSKTDDPGSTLFYGRVCLGPDKTNQDLILSFIVQGPDIYLDRNNDSVAQADERLQTNELPVINDDAAGVKYHVHELRLTKGVDLVSRELPQSLAMTVSISGKVDYEQIGQIAMSTEPQSPQWVHFHGNNRLIFGDQEIQLEPEKNYQLKVHFGTNAVGQGRDLGTPKILEADKSVDWQSLSYTDRFATILPNKDGIYPEMTIEIPTRGETFVGRIPLKEFC
jgi:hypothetical protein